MGVTKPWSKLSLNGSTNDHFGFTSCGLFVMLLKVIQIFEFVDEVLKLK